MTPLVWRGLGQQLGGAGATEDKGGPEGSAEPVGIEGMGGWADLEARNQCDP